MTGTSASVLRKLLIIFLVISGLYFGREFLMPVAIAAILAALFLPFCSWLERIGTPKLLSPLLCLLVLGGFVAGIISLLGWQVSALMDDAEQIKERAVTVFAQIQQFIYDLAGIPNEEQIRILKEQQASLSAVLSTVAGSVAGMLANAILVLVYIFLFLYYRVHLHGFVVRLAAPGQKAETQQVVSKAVRVSQQYLIGLAKMIACLWVLYGIGFSIVGVKNAIFFAILCGLLEIIPFIGNITGTTLTVLVSAAQGASGAMLIGIVVTYGIVQFIQGWVLEAIIVGPQVKINPLFTILALVLGELIWGIPGIVLAIPALAVLKIFCDHIEPLKPYGFLFGETEKKKNSPGFLQKLGLLNKWRAGRKVTGKRKTTADKS